MKSRRVFFLSLALGTLIAVIPLFLKLRRDPFDAAGSYAIWWIGLFVASAIIGFRESGYAKKVAQGVRFWLPALLVAYFIVMPESANLWLLSLIFATVVGMLPAFVLTSF